jgi:hypothetical protein
VYKDGDTFDFLEFASRFRLDSTGYEDRRKPLGRFYCEVLGPSYGVEWLKLVALLLGKGDVHEKAAWVFDEITDDLLTRETFLRFIDKLFVLVGDLFPLLLKQTGLISNDPI